MLSSKILQRCHKRNVLSNIPQSCFPKLYFSLNVKTLLDEKIPLETNESQADHFGSLGERSKSKVSGQIANKNVKVVKIKKRPELDRYHEADVFGNLSEKKPIWYPDFKEKPIVDNDASDNSEVVRNISRKFRNPEVYLENMKQLVSEKRVMLTFAFGTKKKCI